MFCTNCGSQIPENARYCPKCGASVSPINQDHASFDQRQTSQKQQNPSQSTSSMNSNNNNTRAVVSLALGIGGLLFALIGLYPLISFLGLIALILTIIGLVLIIRFKKEQDLLGQESGTITTAALALNIIGLIFSIISSIEFAGCVSCGARILSAI